jgi:dolichol kinase
MTRYTEDQLKSHVNHASWWGIVHGIIVGLAASSALTAAVEGDMFYPMAMGVMALLNIWAGRNAIDVSQNWACALAMFRLHAKMEKDNVQGR